MASCHAPATATAIDALVQCGPKRRRSYAFNSSLQGSAHASKAAMPHGSRMSGKCQRRKSRGRARSLTSVDERVAPLPLEPAFSLGQI